MSTPRRVILFGIILAIAAGSGWLIWWKRDQWRRESLDMLTHLQHALAEKHMPVIVDMLVLPHDLARKKPEEVLNAKAP